ncbi:hypothetical protein PPSIR1_33826 [Plesiocystis pacifica SIR-1]|uniref:DUF4157 domain-containing protein n=1 Tax=Plesiocystis pacifica SIR-1 TaxID=391625 RepID=A6GBN2_9BACT|nr:hypothetical protein [Plesiocystis pacifica]EDM76738.1 hypothetical protein PPSIR1_33826 [Plesiocystis pacifica SIR-1]
MPRTAREPDRASSTSTGKAITHAPERSPGEEREALQELADASAPVKVLERLQLLADEGVGGSRSRSQSLAIARDGVSGSAGDYPHRGQIQSAFGRHSIGGIQGHTDQLAHLASKGLGARGYSVGEHVGFRSSSPSVFEATHEAVHYLQKRAGLSLPGGMGRAGDAHEQQANAVAGEVAAGRGVEGMLDRGLGSGSGSGSSSGAEGLQLLGEKEALASTRGMAVANLKSSFKSTGGKSYGRFKFASTTLSDRYNFGRVLQQLIIRTQATVTNKAQATTWKTNNRTHLNRFLFEALDTGMCRQLSEVVASRLVESTTGQWVYILGATGASGASDNHAFVITSPTQLPSRRDVHLGKLLNLGNLSSDELMVADAWDNHKYMNLDRYLRKEHHQLGDNDLDRDRLNVEFEEQARGQAAFTARFPAALIQGIHQAATGSFERFESEHSSEYKAMKKDQTGAYFDFPRKENLSIEHDDAARLYAMTQGESNNVRRQAFLNWAADLRGRRMDWNHGSARASFKYMLSENRLKVHARALLDAIDLNNENVPRAIDGADLWRYIKYAKLDKNRAAQARRKLVQSMSDTQVTELQAAAGDNKYNSLIAPFVARDTQEETTL